MSNSGYVTYRLADRMVYVSAAQSYTQAVSLARQTFPSLLPPSLPNSRIRFTIWIGQAVRISESAWTHVVPQLTKGQLVDVLVLGDDDEVAIPSRFELDMQADFEPPPRYEEPVQPQRRDWGPGRVLGNNSSANVGSNFTTPVGKRERLWNGQF